VFCLGADKVINIEKKANLEPHSFITTKSVAMTKERILLVDDEELVVSVEQQMLERYFGYEVTALTSSIEALQVFRAEPGHFDLVITDMIMPKMTGDILARELTALRPDIPIILCTGYSDCLIKNKAEETGGAFLMKPFDLYEVAKTIRKVLHKD
jgi:two-component system cell cycle sensor histidine kinase/response regulator CckA